MNNKPLNILHLSTNDIRGGAAKVSNRLHSMMKFNGYNSYILVLEKDSTEKDVFAINNKLTFFEKNILRFKQKFFKEKEIQYDTKYYFHLDQQIRRNYPKSNFLKAKNILNSIPIKPDLIFLYWVNGFMDAKLISKLYESTKVPIIWYLMDMEPLTGGCHYNWECLGYQTGCKNCPAILTPERKNLAEKKLINKRKAFKNIDISIIAGTNTEVEYAKNSYLFNDKPIFKIKPGIDENLFHPNQRILARKQFKLQNDKFIIYCNAELLKDKRKGFKYFIETISLFKKYLTKVEAQNVMLFIVGRHFPDIDLPFDYVYKEFITSKELFAITYRAADVFISPSIQDAGPITVLESLLSGTPVLAFKVGVANELIENGKTGYLSAVKDSKSMAENINKFFQMSKEEMELVKNNCRKTGIKSCSTQAHLKSIESILKLKNLID